MALEVVAPALAAFATSHTEAGSAISTAGSVGATAMLIAAALGSIGATYLAAHGPAQAANLASTLEVTGVDTGIGAATAGAAASFLAADAVWPGSQCRT